RIFTILLDNLLDSEDLLRREDRHIWLLKSDEFSHKSRLGYLGALGGDESMLLESFESKIPLHRDRAIRILEILSARDGLPSRPQMSGIRKVQQFEQLGFAKRLYGFMVREKHDQLHELSEVHFHKTPP